MLCCKSMNSILYSMCHSHCTRLNGRYREIYKSCWYVQTITISYSQKPDHRFLDIQRFQIKINILSVMRSSSWVDFHRRKVRQMNWWNFVMLVNVTKLKSSILKENNYDNKIRHHFRLDLTKNDVYRWWFFISVFSELSISCFLIVCFHNFSFVRINYFNYCTN